MTQVATRTKRTRQRPVRGRPSKGEIEDLQFSIVPAEAPPQGPAVIREAVNTLAQWLVRYHEARSKKPGESP